MRLMRSCLLFALWSALHAPAVFAAEGLSTPAVDPQVPRVDFRGTTLGIDSFARGVRFAYGPGGPVAEFETRNLSFILAPPADSTFEPPAKAARGRYPETLVAGRPNQPDLVLLGGERHLRLFDAKTKTDLWRVEMPAAVQAVQLAAHGGTAVAALADGTVRWFETKAGALLLTLFPHPDRENWVAWTRSGYWFSSPGGRRIFAWQSTETAKENPNAIERILYIRDESRAARPPELRVTREGTFVHGVRVQEAVQAPAPAPAAAGRPEAPPEPPRPNLYLLAVGVSAYTNPSLRLDFPAKDAADVAAAWKAQEGKLYAKVETRVLADPKLADIQDGLEWLEKQTTASDVAVLFFAGHGINDPRTGEYWFLPREADFSARRRTLLSHRDLESVFASIPGKVLFFLDTCHSGNLLGGKSRDGAAPGELQAELLAELQSAGRGVVVFSATTGAGLAQEDVELGNGAFTKALVEALQGKADGNGDRSVWVAEIETYLGRRVRDLTGGLQTPTTAKPANLPDFPLALLPR